MTTSLLELSVVVPVYNEDLNIGQTLQNLAEALDVAYEILVVYDFDEDNTLPVVRQLMPKYPQVRLVKNDIARGPSGAIRAGIRESKGSRILVAMADGCDDFSQIDEMMRRVPATSDIVCPSRYCKGGKQMLKGSLKVWAPQTAGFLLGALTGLGTVDPTNSFKLYNAEMVQAMRLQSTVSFSVTLEIVAKAHAMGYRISEIPTTWRDRQFGKTNFKLGRSLVTYFPWFCLAVLRNRIFRVPANSFRRRFLVPRMRSSQPVPDFALK